MTKLELFWDDEHYTTVFVPRHLSGFLRFSVIVNGKRIDLEAHAPDPNRAIH